MRTTQSDRDRIVPGGALTGLGRGDDVRDVRNDSAGGAGGVFAERCSAGRALEYAAVGMGVATAPDQQGMQDRPELTSGRRQLVQVPAQVAGVGVAIEMPFWTSPASCSDSTALGTSR